MIYLGRQELKIDF